MKRFVALVLGIVLASAASFAAESQPSKDKPIWLVVTRPMFEKAIEPLAKHRAAEGFEVVISTKSPTDAIAALPRPATFVLIVGDEEEGKSKELWYEPSKRLPQYNWAGGQSKTFVSDLAYGDTNGDGLPEIPVGRLPVRTAEQLTTVVKKILAFEAQPPKIEDLRMPVWEGSALYGDLVEGACNRLLVDALQNKAPAWAEGWIIYGSLSSPFCGRPQSQPDVFAKRILEGASIATMIGHGNPDGFFSMDISPRQSVGYTTERARKDFAKASPTCPLVIICCSCGKFDGPVECLGETVLLQAGGPVACVAATTESHPLPNYFAGLCMLSAGGDRLGTYWLQTQQAAIKSRNLIVERLLRDVESAPGQKVDEDKLRRDGMLMYAIIGDPATRLVVPQPLNVTVDRQGDGWHWKAEKPAGAKSLDVSIQAPHTKTPRALTQPAGQKLLDEANDQFVFKPLATIGADKPWEGTVNKEGTLRVVTIVGDRIYAGAVKLGASAATSAAGK